MNALNPQIVDGVLSAVGRALGEVEKKFTSLDQTRAVELQSAIGKVDQVASHSESNEKTLGELSGKVDINAKALLGVDAKLVESAKLIASLEAQLESLKTLQDMTTMSIEADALVNLKSVNDKLTAIEGKAAHLANVIEQQSTISDDLQLQLKDEVQALNVASLELQLKLAKEQSNELFALRKDIAEQIRDIALIDNVAVEEGKLNIKLSTGKAFSVQLPLPVAVARGDRGEPGLDKQLILPQPSSPGFRYEKNFVVSHNGGLFMACRATNGDPSDDPLGFVELLDGIASIFMQHDPTDTRRAKLQIERSSGSSQSFDLDLPVPRVRGHWKSDDEYSLYDLVSHGFGVWSSVTDKAQGEPGKSNDWLLWYKPTRGQRGLQGERGSDGRNGISVDEIHLVDDGGFFVRSDGSKGLVTVKGPEHDNQNLRLSFRGMFDASQSYSRGDLVNHGDGLFVALEEVGPTGAGYLSIDDPDQWETAYRPAYGTSSGVGPSGFLNPTAPIDDSLRKLEWTQSGPEWVDARADYRVYATTILMNSVPVTHRTDGTMCYNIETGRFFLWRNNAWRRLRMREAPGPEDDE